MPSLAERAELVGFFSYSREDDEDSKGALSALRDRIQRELRGQLGRSPRDFRLWQDKEAIAPGKLWESEINAAVAQSVFFIPIVTPTTVRSHFCQFEFEAFSAREQALGRADLIFPLLYIRVPALEDASLRDAIPVLSMIARRQYSRLARVPAPRHLFHSGQRGDRAAVQQDCRSPHPPGPGGSRGRTSAPGGCRTAAPARGSGASSPGGRTAPDAAGRRSAAKSGSGTATARSRPARGAACRGTAAVGRG